MFSQAKVKQFTLQNYHWLIAILFYLFILNITMMSYTEITNIYVKLGLVFLYSVITWGYLTLIYFMYMQYGYTIEKAHTNIINTAFDIPSYEFDADDKNTSK